MSILYSVHCSIYTNTIYTTKLRISLKFTDLSVKVQVEAGFPKGMISQTFIQCSSFRYLMFSLNLFSLCW